MATLTAQNPFYLVLIFAGFLPVFGQKNGKRQTPPPGPGLNFKPDRKKPLPLTLTGRVRENRKKR